MLGNILNGIL